MLLLYSILYANRSLFFLLSRLPCSHEDTVEDAESAESKWKGNVVATKPAEAVESRGTKATKREYELALSAFYRLAREVSISTSYAVEHGAYATRVTGDDCLLTRDSWTGGGTVSVVVEVIMITMAIVIVAVIYCYC